MTAPPPPSRLPSPSFVLLVLICGDPKHPCYVHYDRLVFMYVSVMVLSYSMRYHLFSVHWICWAILFQVTICHPLSIVWFFHFLICSSTSVSFLGKKIKKYFITCFAARLTGQWGKCGEKMGMRNWECCNFQLSDAYDPYLLTIQWKTHFFT